MPQLLFRREFRDAILDGSKTTTLRRWKGCHISAGNLVRAPGIGFLKVHHCDEVQLSDLKPHDAKADGFASLAELLATLKRIYPDQTGDGKSWYRVEFELETSEENQHSNKVAPPAKALRHRLAKQIRAELDKAVRLARSSLSL